MKGKNLDEKNEVDERVVDFDFVDSDCGFLEYMRDVVVV